MQIADAAVVAPAARIADFLELTKPRITFLVLVTTAVGYALGADSPFQSGVFLALLVGTALVSGGASALNQWAERDADALMARTSSRPLPSGRLAPGDAVAFGASISAVGLALLATAVGVLTALLALASLAIYVFVYTPLKRTTALCTLVGAVPGAIPPMMGWAAARGTIGREAWALFAVLFLWQLPHFLAIAWIHREDYARAGFPMLPVSDAGGEATARQSVAYAAALVPVTLVAGAFAAAGPGYLWSAVALGAAFLACTVFFAVERSMRAARWVFLASVLYLPAVLGLMVLDR